MCKATRFSQALLLCCTVMLIGVSSFLRERLQGLP
jgi:hypothetical protein